MESIPDSDVVMLVFCILFTHQLLTGCTLVAMFVVQFFQIGMHFSQQLECKYQVYWQLLNITLGKGKHMWDKHSGQLTCW